MLPIALGVLAWLRPLALHVRGRHAPVAMCTDDRKHVVIVGGGWAGYTAADSLSTDPTVKVTLLDAAKQGGGLAGGYRTAGGRPVEAGIHGFWREYTNTFAVIDSLGLSRDEVLTPYTPSVLVSKRGKVATAPVLATSDGSSRSTTSATAVESPLTPSTLRELLQYSPLVGILGGAPTQRQSPQFFISCPCVL